MNHTELLTLLKKERILIAECYDMGERRMRTSAQFQLTRKVETETAILATFVEKNFGLLVSLRLEVAEKRLQATIPPGGITEWNSLKYRLMRLSLFPDLMQTKVGEEGAYLLPIASGMLVDFSQRTHHVHTDRIYMDQAEWEKFNMMNCFGCLKTGQNLFAIIEEGDFFCQVISEFNDEGINRIYPTFLIRKHPGDMLRFDPLTMLVHDAGHQADYDDFALLYRNWFLSRGACYLRDSVRDNDVLAYSAQALRVKVFLAQKFPYVPDASTPVKVHTTFQETCLILDEMKASGIDKAVITLVGWNLGGHDGAYPTHFPIEPSIGGERDLRRLIEHAKQLGYQIVPHDNWTDIYRNSPDFDYEYVARDEGQEPVAAGLWGGGQAYKACPMVQLRRYGYEFQRIQDLGFMGHYYLDAQSTALWTCHAPNHPANEREFALALASIASIPRSMYGAVSIECSSAYSVPFVDEVAGIHFGANFAPLDILAPKPIPFFHIALHGLLIYHSSGVQNAAYNRDAMLQGIAFGATPCMEVSYRNNGGNGGEYRHCLSLVKEPYETCYKKLNLAAVPFASFKEPTQGVYLTRYEDGTEIAVNTTDKDTEGLPAHSWTYNGTQMD